MNFISTTQLRITLTNDLNANDWGISSQLTGIDFSVASLTGVTLNSVDATGGIVDCSSGAASCPPGSGSSPFDWTANAGSPGSFDFLLSAGNGSYQPYGIVNDTVVGNTDGMSNAQHNPLLLGPVVFDLTVAGLDDLPVAGEVEVGFFFGTAPDYHVVPLPAAAWLLGSGLLALAGMVRTLTRPRD